MNRMIDATKRYIALFGGMGACMLVMALAVGGLQSLQGVPGPTVGLAASPVSAAIGILLSLVVALAIALAVGRVVNAAVGAFVLGTGIAVLSMQCGTHANAVFVDAGPVAMAIETLVWGVLVLLMAMVLMRFTGPLPDQPWNEPKAAFDPGAVFSAAAGRSSWAGFLRLAAGWVVLSNDLKGQAIFAATAGAIFVGLVGRILAPRTQPVLLFAAPVIVGALGQLTVAVTGGDGVAAFVAGTSPRLGMAMPMDYAAGALMGVSMGLGWSRSFVEEHTGD